MRDVTGCSVLMWAHRPGVRRPGQWLPYKRESYYKIRKGRRTFLIHWKPHHGLWVLSSVIMGVHADGQTNSYPRPTRTPMKRRIPTETADLPLPGLPGTSMILAKLPKLREFLTDTEYEDKTRRTPGYMWFMNRGHTFEVILFDPDSGARLPCRGGKIDEVLALAELMLNTDDARWEQDKYLTEQLAKRKKSKKAS